MRILAAVAVLALAGCASGPRMDDRSRAYLGEAAEPSAVIAAELAFAREAQERGQWSAFRKYAADGAVMFVPQKTDAQAWLKGRADPPEAVRWQPHEVLSSCDGSLAITRGAAQWPNGAHGDFLTVWQRQANGGYRWILDIGQLRADALKAPEFIKTHVATCKPGVPSDQRVVANETPAIAEGQSRDGTLRFKVIAPANGVVVQAVHWNGAAFEQSVVASFELR